MLWDELELDRLPPMDELLEAARRLFPVQAGPGASAPLVRLEVAPIGGDFPWRVGVYVDSAPADLDRTDGARALAAALGVRILRSDDDPNPYTRELVEPTGAVRRVALDVALLDAQGALHIDPIASARVARERRDEWDAYVMRRIARYQDLDLGVPVTTLPQAHAVTALTSALFASLHPGAPRAALDAATRDVRAAFAPEALQADTGLRGLLEAADCVRRGDLDG